MGVNTLSGSSRGGKILTLNGSSQGGSRITSNNNDLSFLKGKIGDYINDSVSSGSGSGLSGKGSLINDDAEYGDAYGSAGYGGGRSNFEIEALLAAQRAAAEQAYNESMERLDATKANSLNRLNSAWDVNKNMLKSNLDTTLNRLQTQYDYSRGVVDDDAKDSLREAYINYMMNKKNLAQGLSAMGMSGGATESSMAKMYNNYGSSRNNINTTLAKNVANLLNELINNKSSANQLYNSQYADAQNQYASQLNNLEQYAYNQEAQLLAARAAALANVTTGSNMAGYASYLNALQNYAPTVQNASFNSNGYAQKLADINNSGKYTPTTNTLAQDLVTTTAANNMGSVTDYAKWKAMADSLASQGATAQDIIYQLKQNGLPLDQVYSVLCA